VKKAKRTTTRTGPARRAKGKGQGKGRGRKVKATTKKQSKAKAKARRTAPKNQRARNGDSKWTKFVEDHGVVLASARGPVPSVAAAIAGEPIVGSWWSHAKAQAIFDALSVIDDSLDIRCFKLVGHKITFVHRRLWPALARLAEAGVLSPDRVVSIQQEHMPTGEHRNITTPFPDWVPDEVARAAATLSVDDARAQLGSWV
jgi:hypothetical protein